MLSEAGFQIWCLFLSICSRTAGGGEKASEKATADARGRLKRR
ncbi:unnamed protein product [Brassica oleracea var. botrytis]|uniref:BnaC08g09800D protein n=2 Tax=Brassica TaxID=3705 RepID=A0A078HGB8_BRANA|nr:BnaC08g09800D [Brassica napus]VDD55004.1 unnamed protein product [Brassica oleracea]